MLNVNVVFGIHSVKALLEAQPNRVEKIYVLNTRDDRPLQAICTQAENASIPIIRLPKNELDHLLAGKHTHQGVIAVCEPLAPLDESTLKDLIKNQTEAILLLVLDGVQDPHNLGACLRNANAFGVHAVIAPKDRAVGLTAVAQKAASGAAEITPFIRVTNLARTLRWLKEQGVWLVGATADAEKSIIDIDLKGNIAIVLGGEGEGMRQLTKQSCDFLAHIPMFGSVESINVSVATGVCLYEAQRQRVSIEE